MNDAVLSIKKLNRVDLENQIILLERIIKILFFFFSSAVTNKFNILEFEQNHIRLLDVNNMHLRDIVFQEDYHIQKAS